MAMKDDQGAGGSRHPTDSLRVISLVVLFPFLWIGIVVNFFGLAERISFIPGISREGGLVSGVIALMVTLIVLAVVIGGVSVVTGGGIPVIGGDEDLQDTPSSTSTPTSTPTLGPKPTPTTTSTASPEPMTDLERFEANFRERVNLSMKRDYETGVPTLATGYLETEHEQTELWIVFWECDKLDSLKEQRVTVAASYTNAVGDFDSTRPDRLRVFGVTNLKQYNDTITNINTSQAIAVNNGELDPGDFTEDWNERQREPTKSETDIAYQMVVNESGEQRADEAFNQHHREIGGCPGGAQDPTPPNETDSNARISASGPLLAAEPNVP